MKTRVSALLFAAFTLSTSALHAAGVIVTTNTDEDNGSLLPAAGGGGGISLREAVKYSASGSDITFAPALSGSIISLVSGELVITNGLTIDASALPGGITVDAHGASRVFNVLAGANVTMNSLKIVNGKTTDTVGFTAGEKGGGIQNAGVLSLIGCTLSKNAAGNGIGQGGFGFGISGGGIYNKGTLTISSSTLSDNSAGNMLFGANRGSGGSGGAIFNEGTLSISSSTFSGNSAGNSAAFGSIPGAGGGIANRGALTITTSTFSANRAGNGGAGGAGGAISNSGTSSVESSTFSGNLAGNGEQGGYGGAIYNAGGMTISSSTLSGNETGRRTLNNTLRGLGGGIYTDNSLLTGLMLKNCIVANNVALEGPDLSQINGNSTLAGANLIGDLAGSGQIAGAAILTGDAKLAPLASNGGPTQTMALLPGSPAIDAAVGSTFTNDQRGFSIVGAPDLGSFEFRNISLPVNGTYETVFRNGAGQPKGCVRATITASGAASGSVKIGSNSYSWSGTLDGANSLTTTVPAGALTLRLLPNAAADALLITGALKPSGQPACVLDSDEKFATTSLGTLGKYTVSLAPGTTGPGGSSWFTFVVDAAGSIVVNGKMADNTTLLGGTNVRRDGSALVYLPLYSGGGYACGRVRFTPTATTDCAGTIDWKKPAVSSGIYSAGFATSLAAQGSRFVPPPDNLHSLIYSTPLAAKAGFLLTGGNFALTPINTLLRIERSLPVDFAYPVLTGADSPTVYLSRKNGVVSGTFREPNNPRVIRNISGVMLQKSNRATGFQIGKSLSGAFEFSPQ